MLFKEQQDGWIWKLSIWLVTSSCIVLMIQATLALYDILMEWFQLFCVSYMPAASHKVSVQENIWVGRSCLKKSKNTVLIAWPSLVSEWNERSISKSLFGLTHPIKFLLMRTYGLEEDVVLIISRWLLIGWPSSISEWNDLSNSWSPFCLEESLQFSDQEKIWVGRCCLKNFKMAV